MESPTAQEPSTVLVTRITYTFRDAESRTATLALYVAQSSVLEVTAIIKTALAQLSNATVRSMFDSPAPIGRGTRDLYQSVLDKATLHFETAAGSRHTHELPAPKRAIFHADGVTLNAKHPEVQVLVQLLLAHSLTRSGQPYMQFFGGLRVMRKR
jgi:hypothetical protein